MSTYLSKIKFYGRVFRRYRAQIVREATRETKAFAALLFGIAFGLATLFFFLGAEPEDVKAMFLVALILGGIGGPVLAVLVYLATRNIRASEV